MKKGEQHNLISKKIAESKTTLLASMLTLSLAATTAFAYTETLDFWGSGTNSGGSVTFTNEGIGANQLKITFDNTSDYSAAITGIVFNITQDILGASILSFVDGDGTDIKSLWKVTLDVNNETTPGNTKFDVGFETSTGIHGGIYNDGVATNTANAFPDIATLILDITNPVPWNFTDVISEGDYAAILRTQRTGINENGSDKIVTSSSSTSGGASTSSTSGGASTSSTSGGASTSGNQVSEPGILALLGIGLLAQAFMFASRRRRLSL